VSAISSTPEVLLLDRAERAVADEISGTDPLVVCVPGLGGLRSSYRQIAARVARRRLPRRGHGPARARGQRPILHRIRRTIFAGAPHGLAERSTTSDVSPAPCCNASEDGVPRGRWLDR
jgi:hypothetical protein